MITNVTKSPNMLHILCVVNPSANFTARWRVVSLTFHVIQHILNRPKRYYNVTYIIRRG